MIHKSEVESGKIIVLIAAVFAAINAFATTEGSAHEDPCLSETAVLSSLATDFTEKRNRLSQFMAEFEPLEQQRNGLSDSQIQAWDQRENWQRLRQNINAIRNNIEDLHSDILTQSARVSAACG